MSPADISLTKWTDTIFQIGWGGEKWVGRRIFGNHIVFEGNQRRSVVTGGGGNPINLSANERGIKYIIVSYTAKLLQSLPGNEK